MPKAKLPAAIRRVRLTEKRARAIIRVLDDFAWRYDVAALLGLGLVQTPQEGEYLMHSAEQGSVWLRRRFGLPDAGALD